jgi:hypothetical protein
MILRIGFRSFDFRHKGEMHFGSMEDALSWVNSLGSQDPDLNSRFRQLLTRYADEPDNARLTDLQVIETVARMLYDRRIVVIAEENMAPSGQRSKQNESFGPPFPLSERLPRSARATTSQPQAIDPPTFDPSLNDAAQANALMAAAAEGKPFCPE